MNKGTGNKIINPITKRLKEAREKADISQKQLGIAAGIDEFSSTARIDL
jgi:transcriptional regulator with XRE-family HTH domain